jgi:hypothetical protein
MITRETDAAMPDDEEYHLHHRDAVRRLSLVLNVTEDDLSAATAALVNEPFSTERLAEALGAMAALKLRIADTLRALQMPGVCDTHDRTNE